MMIPKAKKVRSKKHLKRFAELGCMVCGQACIPHHLIATGTHGMGLKSGDDETVPLCNAHHMELHHNGDEKDFFAQYGFEYSHVQDLAAFLYRETLNN